MDPPYGVSAVTTPKITSLQKPIGQVQKREEVKEIRPTGVKTCEKKELNSIKNWNHTRLIQLSLPKVIITTPTKIRVLVAFNLRLSPAT